MKHAKKIYLLNRHLKLVELFKHGRWDLFHELLFKEAKEGWWFEFSQADFKDCNLSAMPGRFIRFNTCNFDGANLSGADFMPATFEDCIMLQVDLRGANGYAEFIHCDLRGALFDESTQLFPTSRTEMPSSFKNCQLDEPLRILLEKQGVVLSQSPSISPDLPKATV